MKCDRCNNEAGFEISIVGEGIETKTLNLCASCVHEAINMSMNEDSEYHYFQDSLKKLIGVFFDEKQPEATPEDDRRCSFCDARFSDIIETGRFGCDQCYQEFGDQVRETLRMTQGSTNHIGDVPPNFREKKAMQDKISKKKEELQELILSEDYEGAAVIRDEVRTLTAALEGRDHV